MAQPVAAWASSLWQKALEWPNASESPEQDAVVLRAKQFMPTRSASPPPVPIHPQMKQQQSVTDVRAERIVRKVEEQVQGLRASLQKVTDTRGEMLQVDIDAVVADPAAAAVLPPVVLARALVQEREEHKKTRSTVARRDKRVKTLHADLREAKRQNAFLQGRLQTFEETLRALYSNLEDFRQVRDAHADSNHLLPDAASGAFDEFEPLAIDARRQRLFVAEEDTGEIAADG